jgi:FkbM family methyltransferase
MIRLKDKIRRFVLARKDFHFRFALAWLLRQLKKDESLYTKLVLLFRDELIVTAEKYPSLINKYNRHIEKAIRLVHRFNLQPQNTIVDVGAGSGEFTTMFAKAYSNAKVYAFEPIVKNFEKVKKECNGLSNVILVNKALGSATGKTEINIASNIHASSIFELKTNEKRALFSRHVELAGRESITIPRLDDEIPFSEKINILKLDVQGFEVEVLKGGINTLKNTSIVVCEVSNHNHYVNGAKYFQLDELLRINGFSLFNFYPANVENEQICEWDSIYVSNEILKENDLL